ncbi:hypothetical protein DC914_RS25625 [Vibrio parahaemolyticus]|uniref:hypothetical protein n=1 Tax=Vibrio parahaemolyticus TaxID=670 RepID=UPI0006BF72DD|nr:hypothetical protein [Vibrio parahaemolyticus]EGR5928000.1 hypothetical protein [Vibrio parahaemolyticus]EJG0181406.1 hypothetical protein [Vibrio parahaemolyticus]KOY37961.1 hypothetical protein ACX10_11995 [Vibrio parahaemolyticus]
MTNMLSKENDSSCMYQRYSIHSGDGGMVAHGRKDFQEQVDILIWFESGTNEGYYIKDNVDDQIAYIIEDRELVKVSINSRKFIDHTSKYVVEYIESPPIPEKTSFEIGVEAYQKGILFDGNPFPEGSLEASDWSFGWHTEQDFELQIKSALPLKA